MKLFSLDSPLYQFISRLYDVLKLNFLWLLCSLPIVTIGASTTAAFSVALKMVDEQEGYIAKEFFKSFKRNIRQGSIMGIITLFGCYALWLNIQLRNSAEGNTLIFTVLIVILIVLLILGNIYAYALMARYDNTIKATFLNSILIATRYFGSTIVLVFLIALEIFLIMWNWTSIFVGFLIGPACIIYTISGFARKNFRVLEYANASDEKSE